MNPAPAFALPPPGRPEAAWAAVRPRVAPRASAAASSAADMSHPAQRWGA
jgi:hypothetical protein